jgi:sporulation protein YlmC with PRC-barrel domain
MLAATAASAQDATDTCIQLQEVAGQIDFAASDVTQEDLLVVIQAGDAAECTVWMTRIQASTAVEGEIIQTEQARVRLEDEVVIEGRVIVDQQQPSVQVDEQAVEVNVSTASPEVSVTEGQIDILVRQAAPTITFDMPQPTITIVQPAPEIIITMPDPSVDVASARPRVEVRQAEPRISISMPEPTVELELYQAENAETSTGIMVERRAAQGADGVAAPEPEVTVARADAQIVYQEDPQEGQSANVRVSRSVPTIRIEQAEPQIEITAAQDPQVNWTQSGEPVVTFLDGTETGGNAGAAGETMAANPGLDSEATGGPAVRRDGYQNVDMAMMTAADLEGATVYGVRGEEIGEIGPLVVDGADTQEVIVDVGGFLGMGERQVRVPFTDLTFLKEETSGEIRVYVDATEERLMGYPEAN